MLKGKKLASMLAVTAMLTSFGLTGIVEGASRAELAAIHVNQSENFQYWNENSPAKKKLVAYVQKVTNPKNPDFIPAEHRLAVFDMDGTLLGERTPSYTDGVFYADRVLHDPNCKVSDEDKKFAQAYWDAISQRKPVPPEIEKNLYHNLYAGLAGMTPQSLDAYAQGFMKKPVIGLTNLTYGESFYLPYGELDRVNEKMNKVSSIVREIGIQPVLAFGNSSGDYSMFRYTLKDNPYKAEVFNILCDDTQREYGRPERAERDKKTSAENGWNTISMKNDWKTIYGDNVKKTQ